MSSNKTEQPTPKKLREARKKGNVAFSKDASSVATYLAGLLFILLAFPRIHSAYQKLFDRASKAASVEVVDGASLAISLKDAINDGFLLSLQIAVPLALVGVFAGYLQTGPVYSPEKIKPDLKKLDPLKKLKEWFGFRGLFELAKTLLKLACVFTIAGFTIWGSIDLLMQLGFLTVEEIGQQILEIARSFLITVGLIFAGVGLLDLGFQRWKWRKDLMMSKDEVRREYKDQEGDPEIKGKRKQIYHEIMNENVGAALKSADAVVVNPTHYAVVIEYSEDEMSAPTVTAKGLDDKAQMIRRMARRRDVPIVRDRPLARALYDVDLQRAVPEELFEAVGQVLLFAWKIRREGGDDFTKAL